MSGRGRALRHGIAWDQRTGFKVRGRQLVEDGERRGILTTRDNADQVHPQRYVRVPPPDGLTYRRGPPAMDSEGARLDLSYFIQSDTHTVGLGFTQQPEGVLRRQDFHGLNCVLNADAFELSTS